MFFDWADQNLLVRDSEAASLGYLEFELQTTYRKAIALLKKESDLSAATQTYMEVVESPVRGKESKAERQSHATAALNAYNRDMAARGPSTPTGSN